MIRRSPATVLAAMLWSLSRVRPFRALLATGAAECDSLVDTMLAASSKARGRVPVDQIAAMKPK